MTPPLPPQLLSKGLDLTSCCWMTTPSLLPFLTYITAVSTYPSIHTVMQPLVSTGEHGVFGH